MNLKSPSRLPISKAKNHKKLLIAAVFHSQTVRAILFHNGLLYTGFEYSNLKVIPPGVGVGEEGFAVTISVDVRNTGKRKGAEVVRVYVKDVECSVERPVKELKGFAKVSLEPGEKKTISIKLNRDAFAFYDSDRRQWVVEAGEFEIMVGSSWKDIRLNDVLMVKIPAN